MSLAAGLFVDPDPGPVLANYGLENLRFVTPVSPGDAFAHHPLADKPADQSEQDPS